MILAEQVFKIIAKVCSDNGVTAYCTIAPQETQNLTVKNISSNLPFVVFELRSTRTLTGTEVEIEYINIRMHVYSQNPKIKQVINTMRQLDSLFNKTSLVFLDSDDGIELMCQRKVYESILPGDDYFWDGFLDFEFVAKRHEGVARHDKKKSNNIRKKTLKLKEYNNNLTSTSSTSSSSSLKKDKSLKKYYSNLKKKYGPVNQKLVTGLTSGNWTAPDQDYTYKYFKKATDEFDLMPPWGPYPRGVGYVVFQSYGSSQNEGAKI